MRSILCLRSLMYLATKRLLVCQKGNPQRPPVGGGGAVFGVVVLVGGVFFGFPTPE